MSDDLDWEQLLTIHRAESEERLATMETALLDLERNPADAEAVESLRRDAHTLKGNAGMFGFNAISGLAHAFEDGLDAMSRRGASPGTLEVLLRAVDALRSAVAASEPGQDLTPAQQDMAARLRGLDAAQGPAVPSAIDLPVEASPSARPSEAPEDARAARATLRVETSRVEALVELASEISIARGRLETLLSAADLPGAAREALDDALPLLSRLNDVALGMRLVPFGPILATHRRTARDAAQAFGREVRLDTAGEDVEIDLALVDRVNEILLHMVRNAVAHGIEAPEAREAAGKSRVGAIRIEATAAAGQVFLDISDDGAGLNLVAIRDRARRLGLEPSGDDRVDAQLVFAAGLSTAATLSEVSGRGVGLDSVKTAIERLAGSIEVLFEPGKGTRFRVSLPLTLAMIRGLYVGIGVERYVLPMDMVRECLSTPEELAFGPDGLAFLEQGAEKLPVLRLGVARLDNPGREDRHIVVVSHGGKRLGLLVDRIVGEGRVVVKPMGRALQGTRSVFGAAILGDGYVALILDVPDIITSVPSLGIPTASLPRPVLHEAH